MRSEPVAVSLINDGPKPLEVVLEPWGEVCSLRPGESLDVLGHGPSPSQLEIAHDPDRITVYGWPGSVLSFYQGGQPVNPSEAPPPAVPSLPAGMSARAFVSRVVGPTPRSHDGKVDGADAASREN